MTANEVRAEIDRYEELKGELQAECRRHVQECDDAIAEIRRRCPHEKRSVTFVYCELVVRCDACGKVLW